MKTKGIGLKEASIAVPLSLPFLNTDDRVFARLRSCMSDIPPLLQPVRCQLVAGGFLPLSCLASCHRRPSFVYLLVLHRRIPQLSIIVQQQPAARVAAPFGISPRPQPHIGDLVQ